MSATGLLHRLRTAALAATFGLAPWAFAQNGNVAVNETGAAADPSALLDVSSVTKGLLVPRTSTLPPAAALPDGLTMYQTSGDENTRGFYVVQNGAWHLLRHGKNGWDLYGNRLTQLTFPNPDYLGTSDNRNVYFRTNNLHRMRLDNTTGFVGVGYPAATAAVERLDINGALGIYYEYPAGQAPSRTAAPGVIRYQPWKTTMGTAPYRYGSLEGPSTTPNNATTWGAVLGTSYFAPLMHSGHWGNINGKDAQLGYSVATVPPTIYQPKTNGWRAFENPYNEVLLASWSRFREAVCGDPSFTEAIIPTGVSTPTWSNTLAPAEQEYVSPYGRKYPANNQRIQFLYLAHELDVELAQAAPGGPTGTGLRGLCPGEPITQIGFYVNTAGWQKTMTPAATPWGDVTVRNAPLGLDQLSGFDNTPRDANTGYGTITGPAAPLTPPGQLWPDAPTAHWQMINLSTPFFWDGQSNVIVEVAVRAGSKAYVSGADSPPNLTGLPGPVWVTQLPVNVSYCAQKGSILPADLLPAPLAGNEWYNPATPSDIPRLIDAPTGTSTYGSSMWRPMIKFVGGVSGVNTTAATSGTGNDKYIQYGGALILEDTTMNAANGLAWGRWRPGFPAGHAVFNYKGKGTISAQHGIYDNTVRLNDHVFDRAFDGRVAPQDAAAFGEQRTLPVGELATFTRTQRHLPTMKGRDDWKRSNGFSLGDLTNQLWTTAETHALYLADLHDRLNALEILAGDRPLDDEEYRTARNLLQAMPAYTDAEKADLIRTLKGRVAKPQPQP